MSGGYEKITSSSGLANYPAKGDSFQWKVKSGASNGDSGYSQMEFLFGLTDADNWYGVRYEFVQDDFLLAKEVNGTRTELNYDTSATGDSYTAGDVLLIEVTWDDGTQGGSDNDLTATLKSEDGSTTYATLTANDSDHAAATGAGVQSSMGSAGQEPLIDAIQLSSSETALIDDFEDSNLAEYTVSYGQGNESLVSSPTYTGSQALALSGGDTKLISTSGLAVYPSAGDRFSYRVRATSDASNDTDRGSIAYGVQDTDNHYYVLLDFDNDKVNLSRWEAASQSKLAEDTSVTLSEDTWYKVVVDWSATGRHTITVFDDSGSQVTELHAVDETWASGGVGYFSRLNTAGTVYYDYGTFESCWSADSKAELGPGSHREVHSLTL